MTMRSQRGGSPSPSKKSQGSRRRSPPSAASSRKSLTPTSLKIIERRDFGESAEIIRETQTASEKLSSLARQVKNLAIRNEELEAFQEAALAPYQRNLDIEAPKRKRKRAINSAGMILSDWHVGQVVDPDKISGANEFNPEVCERRVNRLIEGAMYLLECARIRADIEQFYVFSLGDTINGYIHDELVETNSMSPIDEIFFASDLMQRFLSTIQKEFKKPIRCLGIVGNHGRTGKKLSISTLVNNSYEKVIYQNLAREHGIWQIAKGATSYVNIYGRDYRFTHGTQIKFGGGVGGPLIPINKKIARWNQNRFAHATMMGHLHTPILLSSLGIVVNNSIVGATEYGDWIGCQNTRPSQTFLVFDPDHGIVSCSEVFAE